jgi:hypothetical protein
MSTDESTFCDLQPRKTTIHLHWSGTLEMDFFALCTDAQGVQRLVSFAEVDVDSEAVVQILSEFAFQQVPKDNQEIIQVRLDMDSAVESVDFFAWEFDAVEANESCGFEFHNVFIEVIQEGKRWTGPSMAVEDSSGNALYLGRIQKSDNWQYVSKMKSFMAPLLEELSEVQQMFQNQVL